MDTLSQNTLDNVMTKIALERKATIDQFMERIAVERQKSFEEIINAFPLILIPLRWSTVDIALQRLRAHTRQPAGDCCNG